MLNASDLATYSADQVASLADVDWHAVRNEGFRRHDATLKKIAKLEKQLAALRAELSGAEQIIRAAQLAS